MLNKARYADRAELTLTARSKFPATAAKFPAPKRRELARKEMIMAGLFCRYLRGNAEFPVFSQPVGKIGPRNQTHSPFACTRYAGPLDRMTDRSARSAGP